MKKKIISYAAAGDATSVRCEFTDCRAEICGFDGNRFYIERTARSRVKISEHGGALKIKQTGKRIFRRAEIKIFVPAHCVPDVILKAKDCALEIKKGIYGSLNANCGKADIKISDCSLAAADVSCDKLKLGLSDFSVKGVINTQCDEGSLILEKGFIEKLDIRCNDGDIGVYDALIKDGAVSCDRGSVTATLRGTENDYSLKLVSREGVVNRESYESGENAVSVYTAFANIAVDFTEKVREVYYGYDGVAEDFGVSC